MLFPSQVTSVKSKNTGQKTKTHILFFAELHVLVLGKNRKRKAIILKTVTRGITSLLDSAL